MLMQEHGLFMSFPYVSPEPVLVKRSIISINGSKKTVFSPDDGGRREQRGVLVTP